MELLLLIADAKFHSGEALAQQLGVSRTTISKKIKHWQQCGLDIDVVHGKGYRLQQPIEWLNQQAIWQAIPQHIQASIHHLDIQAIVSSTNDVVAQQLQNQKKSGMVCIAEMQQAGRGRRGRTWFSPPAGTFYGSVGWLFSDGFQVLEGLSLAIGVAVIEALESCGVHDLSLKWPNDILWHGKKLGGVLIEVNAEMDGVCAVVVGVGVNLSLPQAIKQQIQQPSVDIKEITGQRVNRHQITAALISHIVSLLQGYAQQGFNAWHKKWQSYDALYGQEVEVLGLAQAITGTAQGIDKQGAFIINTATGLQFISGGEVSLRKKEH
ncbi:MAG: bifunctional biotin--[acetyl-CoA-carboxylase] ligase/biotin operon repressor BirA [Agitococcus sp.]|jgi:BirA family biotin operon repressor/biotin-[acetyl-CoA-carboxylase] ligase|nr:bifunctional biotin--[acetyl-CoA-carboxylase] ligase/biotin operon repressor BirA [Moraxellaceae bacterium]MBP9215958.1 bifunctional biotin--[acetyl-CoA-carboxylase] ligase/biotin operon repressor BirA [Agitococcus sp.]HQV79702.1 bifunctional biotin--[acetyl-CoA-carboxylase] ligase/biotin operon repressor BirA [Agitococcus sp.]